MPHYLCASKEISGSIYITRISLPSQNGEPGFAPDTDDGEWYFVGPGSRPSIQHYSGTTQFILTFDFLSHLTTRVVDISSWPPTIVNPISQGSTGGPNTTALWTPNTSYPTGSQVKDKNGHVQQATTGGVSADGPQPFPVGTPKLTSIAIASNFLTVTVANNFTIGQTVAFGGMATATFLNGAEVTVATLVGTFPTYTGFTASTTSGTYPAVLGLPATYGPTADVGFVAPVPTWNDSGGITTDNTVTWQDEGVATAFHQNITSASDANALQLQGQNTRGTVDNYFNPPVIDRSLLFFDGLTDQYSVTISLDPGWRPLLAPAGQTIYYRLYRRVIGTLPWILLMNWTPTTFSYTDTESAASPFRYQYSATWGVLFNPAEPDVISPIQHAEGVPGFFLVTVDSTVEHPASEFQIPETLTLNEDSSFSYMYVGERQAFIFQNAPLLPPDKIDFPVSTVGNNSYLTVGGRQAFINVVVPSAVPGQQDEILAPFSGGPNNYSASLSAPMQMYN